MTWLLFNNLVEKYFEKDEKLGIKDIPFNSYCKWIITQYLKYLEEKEV